MAAYAAIISLSNTINRILNHNRISISLAENQQLLSLLDYVTSFQAFLEKFPDKANNLEGQIRELAHEAEDMIEHFMLVQVSSWSDFQTERTIIQLKQIIDNIDLIVGEIKEAYDRSSREEVEPGAALSICKDSIVGFEDYMIDLKDSLCGEPSKLQVIPICGMAGTGKTTLARNVYDDPLIIDHFEVRVWVTISQYSSVQRTLSSLLECLKELDTGGFGRSDEEKVYQILKGMRYLVVMDNIWSSKAWDVVKKVFPNESNGSCVMITTRLYDVASYPDPSSKLYEMDLLSEGQSWNLLKKKVFANDDCPPDLENTGKEIARCCKGWPLALVAIGRILSTTTRNLASWQDTQYILEYLDLEKVMSCTDKEFRCHPRGKQELQLKQVMQEIASIAGEVKEIKDISSSSSKDVERGGADSSAALSSSITAPPIRKDSMVGFEDYVLDMKDRLCGEPSGLQVIPICGMGGIGKTTLARNIYDDPLIVSRFDVRVWVTISQDFSAQRIFSSIMESLKEFDTGKLGESDDEKIHKILLWRRYLVVMDDIWSSEAWDVVRRVFPDDGNGSRVILTTRLSDVASYPDPSCRPQEMSLLSVEHSWDLLKKKVFANQDCPSNLESIGTEIARGCKGLPLTIVVIAGLLSNVSKNRTSWMEIAVNVKSAETAEIEEIFSLSYNELPQHLRPCFLYMGSFPEDGEIHVKKLIRLWIAEGFIKSPTDSDSFEKVAEECLEELVKRNLVLVRKRKWDGRIRSCSLHDLMRDFCIRKSHESKFFLNTMDWGIGKKSFLESIGNQRCINVDDVSSLHGSAIRSFKCSRNCWGKLDSLESARLLRVFDAEPLDVQYLQPLVHRHELFHLRYLAIRYNEDIPISFLMLQNLQTLIIHEKERSSMKVGVICNLQLTWSMLQLRHVYFRGKILFDYPDESSCPLENLQTLSYVSHQSCDRRILKMMPNLKKLKIKCCEGDHHQGAACLNDVVHLHRLENLEIDAGEWVGAQPAKITFPLSLKNLTLKNLKLPWNDIFVVGSLPNLQVLKLELCTCVGGTWETIEGAFPALEVLSMKNAKLEHWITESSHFPRLKRLLIDSCSLEGIPNDIGEIPTLELIRVRGDVNWYLVKSLKQIRREQEDMGNTLKVSIWGVYVSDEDSSDNEDEDDDDGDDDQRSP